MSTQPAATKPATASALSSEKTASTIADALTSSQRPARPSGLTASLAFGWRTLLKIKHMPEQLFDVTVFPIVFTLLFTFLFGGALAGSTQEYVQFLLPGIMVQSLIMITMYTGYTLRNDIEKGVFDRFRSLPIWRPSPLVGMLLGDAVRFTVAAVITGIVGVLLGWRPQGGIVGVIAGIALILLFAFSLGWIWTFLSLILRTVNAIMGAAMMVIMPLTFGSNIFVNPETMPGWLQAWVDVNPVTHLVTAVRDLMNGITPGSELALTFGWSAGLIVVFGTLTMWKYKNPR